MAVLPVTEYPLAIPGTQAGQIRVREIAHDGRPASPWSEWKDVLAPGSTEETFGEGKIQPTITTYI
jgi:hypothetical protein